MSSQLRSGCSAPSNELRGFPDSGSIVASANLGLSHWHVASDADGSPPLSSPGISGVLHLSGLLHLLEQLPSPVPLESYGKYSSHLNMCNGLANPCWTIRETIYGLARGDSCEHENCAQTAFDPCDDIGIHAITDHDGILGVGIECS